MTNRIEVSRNVNGSWNWRVIGANGVRFTSDYPTLSKRRAIKEAKRWIARREFRPEWKTIPLDTKAPKP